MLQGTVLKDLLAYSDHLQNEVITATLRVKLSGEVTSMVPVVMLKQGEPRRGTIGYLPRKPGEWSWKELGWDVGMSLARLRAPVEVYAEGRRQQALVTVTAGGRVTVAASVGSWGSLPGEVRLLVNADVSQRLMVAVLTPRHGAFSTQVHGLWYKEVKVLDHVGPTQVEATKSTLWHLQGLRGVMALKIADAVLDNPQLGLGQEEPQLPVQQGGHSSQATQESSKQDGSRHSGGQSLGALYGSRAYDPAKEVTSYAGESYAPAMGGSEVGDLERLLGRCVSGREQEAFEALTSKSAQKKVKLWPLGWQALLPEQEVLTAEGGLEALHANVARDAEAAQLAIAVEPASEAMGHQRAARALKFLVLLWVGHADADDMYHQMQQVGVAQASADTLSQSTKASGVSGNSSRKRGGGEGELQLQTPKAQKVGAGATPQGGGEFTGGARGAGDEADDAVYLREEVEEEDEEQEALQAASLVRSQLLSAEGASLASLPEGSVWDRSEEGWYLVRINSLRGHLFAWLAPTDPSLEEAQAAEFETWVVAAQLNATPVENADAAARLACTNADPPVTCGTRAVLLDMPTGVDAPPAPTVNPHPHTGGLMMNVVGIVGRQKKGAGYKVLVQYDVGEPVLEDRSKWKGTAQLEAYEQHDPLPPLPATRRRGIDQQPVRTAVPQPAPAHDAAPSGGVDVQGSGTGADDRWAQQEAEMRRQMEAHHAAQLDAQAALERRMEAMLASAVARLAPQVQQPQAQGQPQVHAQQRGEEVRLHQQIAELQAKVATLQAGASPMSSAGAFLQQSQQAHAATLAAQQQVTADSNAALQLLLAGGSQAAAENLFAKWHAGSGQLEHLFVLQQFGMPLVDAQPRTLLYVVAQLHGYSETFKKLGKPNLTLGMEYFHRKNYVLPGTAMQTTEFASVQKGQAHAAAQEPGVIRLDLNVVKRTLPTKPSGGLKALTSIEEWEMAGYLKFEAVTKHVGPEAAQCVLQYVRSMMAMWYTSDVFKGMLSVFMQADVMLQQLLQHLGRTNWTVSLADVELRGHLDSVRSQASRALDRGRAALPLPGATGGGAKGGGAIPGIGAGIPAPRGTTPTTVAEALNAGWQGIKRKQPAGAWRAGKEVGYCINYMFGKCTNTAEGDGCVNASGQRFLHHCVRCETSHPITKPGHCPNPKR